MRGKGAPSWRRHGFESDFQSRQPRQAARERAHIPWTRGIERNPRQQPLQVQNAAECPPCFLAFQQIAVRFGNRFVTRADLRRCIQRPQNCCPQQPLAHRRQAGIEGAKQGDAVVLAGKQRLH